MNGRESLEYRNRLTELLVWGVKRGWQILGRPVNIRIAFRYLGYTHHPVQGVPLVINVNPNVLKEERGTLVLQGLILHELGHHFAHFSDPNYQMVFAKCKADYLAQMLNIIEDEHLERRLRGMNPEWGEAFDALASYAFKGKPMTLMIDQYQALLNLNTVTEVADALTRGEAPGEITGWEFGYDLGGEIDRWVTTVELVDLVIDELVAACPGGQLPVLISESLHRIRLKAAMGWARGGPPGILPTIQDDEIFEQGDCGLEVQALIHISTLLEARPDEKSDPRKYMKRAELAINSLKGDFPTLERFLTEMKSSFGSKWFWNKQRSMLHAMRHKRDFKGAFLPARDMSLKKLRALLGGDFFNPGVILDHMLERWQPVHRENRERPLWVSVPWLDILASDFASDDYRFLVSLRLGLGARGAGGREPVLAALAEVPKNLRKLDMLGIDEVTHKVAACLGDCCLDMKPPNRPFSGRPGDPLGTGRPGSGQVMRKVLDDQQNDLSSPLNIKEKIAQRSHLDAASTDAARRIDHWLRMGTDPGEKPVEKNKPDAQLGAVSQGVIKTDGIPGKGRSRGQGSRTDVQITHDMLNIARALKFGVIETIAMPPPDKQMYNNFKATVQGPSRAMRRFLLTLGQAEREQFGKRQGQRLDPARIRKLAAVNDPQVMIGRETVQAPDLFLGLCIDCSGSMVVEDRLDKALSFATLLMESAKGLEGVECRALGFEDTVLWELGKAGSPLLAGLKPGGGNNDAAGLLAMAKHALLSPCKHRLLIMISDGFPTDCSQESLANLVRHLDDVYNIKSVQVAVAELEADRVAFPDFTDLTQHQIPVAVKMFGRMVQRILLRQYS